jgi:uncharacterized membrane protein YgdD (TMEM256/DUF423 family)
MTEVWSTAVQYHLIHAVALLVLSTFCAAKSAQQDHKSLQVAGWAWIIGTIFFSGSLYALALGAPRWLGPITPLGGLAFLAGWACLLIPSKRRGTAAR